mmetsp:Transcript_19556/g.54595  ORF Transcript_19556/g.54595 Transcript_19556/m.54595 type:complete len:130 (-) Transcript_19556:565-954(-)
MSVYLCAPSLTATSVLRQLPIGSDRIEPIQTEPQSMEHDETLLWPSPPSSSSMLLLLLVSAIHSAGPGCTPPGLAISTMSCHVMPRPRDRNVTERNEYPSIHNPCLVRVGSADSLYQKEKIMIIIYPVK